MSALATHLAAGALFGFLGIVLANTLASRPVWQTPAVIAAASLGAMAGDIDLFVGEHRATTTNLYFLLIAPAVGGAFALTTRWGEQAWLRAIVFIAPGCAGSHLWFDIYGGPGGTAEPFWPLSQTRYRAPFQEVAVTEAGAPFWDQQSVIMLVILYYMALAVLHQRVVANRWPTGPVPRRDAAWLAAGHAVGALLPLPFLMLVGELSPVGAGLG